MLTRRKIFPLLGAASTLGAQDSGSLYPLIESLATPYTHSFLDPRWKSVSAWRAAARAVVLEAFAYAPAPVAPDARIVEREDMGDVIREKLVFSTSAQFRVPAYLHLPKRRSGRAPAIVDLHSHGGMFLYGKEKVIELGDGYPGLRAYHKANYESRPTATELARRGYVVLTIDAFPFGERRLMMPEDEAKHGWDRQKYSAEDAQYLNGKCRQKESTIVKSLTYAGATWPGIVAWDDMRSVDYLVSRPEVDPARIGCVGVSLGGYRSLLLAGLDPRIRAGCVVGFMSTVRSMIRQHVDTHSFVHFIPQIHRRLDLPDVVAMRAPKPLLVLQCKRDGLFPLRGMEESVEKLGAIYKKAGAPEGAFESRFYDVPHIFNIEMQEHAFAWLERNLKS